MNTHILFKIIVHSFQASFYDKDLAHVLNIDRLNKTNRFIIWKITIIIHKQYDRCESRNS